MPQRRSIRLHHYDYAQPGAYFVTICTDKRACLLGEIVGDEMRLNGYGLTVAGCWKDLPKHYSQVELDAFVVMPNHMHGIIVLKDEPVDITPPVETGVGAGVGAGLRPAPTAPWPKRHGLPEIVRAFKSFSARRINELRNALGVAVWQRNYYEHIVRGEADLHRIRLYIEQNPARWTGDTYHARSA